MGKRRSKSQTLPSSPTHSFKSSSSSDFEFAISISPRKSSAALCPADELFYKGKLLPLHLSPRLSMVRTIILASSSSSSSSESAASRDSTASRSSNESSTRSSFSGDLALLAATVDCDSSRTSSVAEDDELKRLNTSFHGGNNHNHPGNKPKFSLSRFSSVFRKEPKVTRSIPPPENQTGSSSSVKRVSVSAKEVIRRYLKKVKPLYEKLSKQHQKMAKPEQGMKNEALICKGSDVLPVTLTEQRNGIMSQSFSGNLGYPRRRKTYVASCPSSMRSSPNHSGALNNRSMLSSYNPLSCEVSSMEELQNAIQGAIMHCKNSMTQV